MTLEEILLNTPGVIIETLFTYDIINRFQVELSAFDSNPDSYHIYIIRQRLDADTMGDLLNKIETALRDKNLITDKG